MSTNTHLTLPFLAGFAAIACFSSCGHDEGTATPSLITCPPGMSPAATQPICIHGLCGDGHVDADEACDDGNVVDGDGCSADCLSTEICGNQVVDRAVGEVCDDGNTLAGDDCCDDCRSCPELATPVVDQPEVLETPDVAFEAPPCPPAWPGTPFVLPAAMDDGGQQASEGHGRGSLGLDQVRLSARFDQGVRRRMAQSHARLTARLQAAHQTIAVLEQANEVLRMALEAKAQELDGAYVRLATERGVALQ